MTSPGNVDLVRDWFGRWNAGERSFLDEDVHPDVSIVSRFQAEPYRGRDGLHQWVREIDDQFQDWQLVVDEWRDANGTVVALGHLHMHGHGSDIEFDQPMGWLVDVYEGRLLRIRIFIDPVEAVKAAGLQD